ILRRSSRDALSITNSVFPSVRRPTPYTHHLTRSTDPAPRHQRHPQPTKKHHTRNGSPPAMFRETGKKGINDPQPPPPPPKKPPPPSTRNPPQKNYLDIEALPSGVPHVSAPTESCLPGTRATSGDEQLRYQNRD